MKKRILLLVLCLLLAGCSPVYYEAPLRLHIIANSNSRADQQAKLLVRDEILETMNAFSSKEEAVTYARTHREELADLAKETLQQVGMDYGARAEVGRFAFPEKTYGNQVYPAGDYDALRLVLGRGSGENWWCVIFPPLCLTAVEVPGEEVQVSSALMEWLQALFGGTDHEA